MKTVKIERNDHHRIADIQKIIRSTHYKYPKIIVYEEVIKSLYRHAESEMHQEVGGYLLGFPVIDQNTNITTTFIKYVHLAKYISTPVHVTMDPKSLILVDQLCKQTNTLLVGYYHSHPFLSVFQSGEDVKNFEMYYPEFYQVAIVIDPSKTTPYTFKHESDWIGYFMWDQNNHTPLRVPKQNIVICCNWDPKILTDGNFPKKLLTVPENSIKIETIHSIIPEISRSQKKHLITPKKYPIKVNRKKKLKNISTMRVSKRGH